MSYGTPPPSGTDPNENDPTAPGGYGSAPPPPPSYGPQDQPTYGSPQQPSYGQPPPPPYGQQVPPSYGAPQQPGGYPPPPQSPYGAASQSGYAAAPPPYGGPAAPVGNLVQWPQRALGYIIDGLIQLPGYILVWIGEPRVNSATGAMEAPGVLYYLGLLVILGIAVWNRWIKGGSTGQTVGRGVVGSKLVAEATGQPIGAGKAFLRDVCHIVDSLICYVGWLFPLWDNKRQTLADKIVGTVVVSSPKS